MQKKYITGLIVVLIVGLGLGYSLFHKSSGFKGTVENIPTWFYNGLSAGNLSTTGYSGSKFSVDSTGALTVSGITNTGNSVSVGNATRTGNDTITGLLTYQTIAGNMSNSSSTPTTTLSSLASVGHLTVGAGQTIQSASTTAIDANSIVDVGVEQTSPIAGTTCNTNFGAGNNASTSLVTTVFASTTNTSLNGFTIKVLSAPVTNPFCVWYKIFN